MREKNGSYNNLHAKTLIHTLYQLGVHTYCLAPGSRSTPLAIAIAEHPLCEKILHFDERGLGFCALGVAKASSCPVVLVVTSGTAAGNLLPAIMEASESHVPLILLTADRPPELRSCGSNQTTDQVKMFDNFVRHQIDLPCPEESIPSKYLQSALSFAVMKARSLCPGPVHINCLFREPLFSSEKIADSPYPIPCHYKPIIATAGDSAFKFYADLLGRVEKGVIVLGAMAEIPNMKPIYELAKTLEWPIFAESTCPVRAHALPYYEMICRHASPGRAEAVLHFGDRIVSKVLEQYLGTVEGPYLLVHPIVDCYDPSYRVTEKCTCAPDLFCEKLLPDLKRKTGSWMNEWKEKSLSIAEKIDTFFSEQSELSEPGLFWQLEQASLPGWALFLANSMPIRDANTFFHPKNEIGPLFSNRGLSGIDGNIATVCGITHARKRPTLAILGDLTSLHDLNSLALVHKSPHPIVIFIVNNGGGGIFSFLPISEEKEVFEDYFAHRHEYSFAKAAEMFCLPYTAIARADDLQRALQLQEKHPHSCIFELFTDRENNKKIHQTIHEIVKESLCLATLP